MRIGRSAVTSSQSNHKTNLLNQFQVRGDEKVNKKQGKYSKIGSLKCTNLYSKKNEKILKKKNFALLFKNKKNNASDFIDNNFRIKTFLKKLTKNGFSNLRRKIMLKLCVSQRILNGCQFLQMNFSRASFHTSSLFCKICSQNLSN